MNKTTHQVEMRTTRENMIRMLETTKEYLETLSDEELFKLGIEQGLWKMDKIIQEETLSEKIFKNESIFDENDMCPELLFADDVKIFIKERVEDILQFLDGKINIEDLHSRLVVRAGEKLIHDDYPKTNAALNRLQERS